jgi:hypothetical protein
MGRSFPGRRVSADSRFARKARNGREGRGALRRTSRNRYRTELAVDVSTTVEHRTRWCVHCGGLLVHVVIADIFLLKTADRIGLHAAAVSRNRQRAVSDP